MAAPNFVFGARLVQTRLPNAKCIANRGRWALRRAFHRAARIALRALELALSAETRCSRVLVNHVAPSRIHSGVPISSILLELDSGENTRRI